MKWIRKNSRSSVALVISALVLNPVTMDLVAQDRDQSTHPGSGHPAFAGIDRSQAGSSHERKPESAPKEALRTISVNFTNVPTLTAIEDIASRGKVRVSYNKTALKMIKPVSLRASDITPVDALRSILAGTGYKVTVMPGKQIVISPETPTTQSPDSVRGRIEGRVVDSSTNSGVQGVTIDVAGAGKQTVTRSDGSFILPDLVGGMHTLRVIRIGYERKEISVSVRPGATARPTIFLSPTLVQLNEVVTSVSGSQRKLEVGTSIATINASDVVENEPIRNLSDLLSARAPGAQVLTSSGTVGAGSRIRVRGIGRISGRHDPIVIVDGVRLETSFDTPMKPSIASLNIGGRAYGSTNTSSTSRLDDIDPNSIETIDILKGPSAATLYGSDAANGVIVITTKRGQPGVTRWAFSGETGSMKVTQTFTESYRGWGTSPVFGGNASCTNLSLASKSCLSIDSVTSWNPLNHDDTSPFGTGRQNRLNANVSGGSQQYQYYFGFSMSDDVGVLRMPSAEIDYLKEIRGTVDIPSWQKRPNSMSRLSFNNNIRNAWGQLGDLALSVSVNRQRQLNMSDNVPVTYAMRSPGYRDSLWLGWPMFVGARPADFFTPKGTNHVLRGYSSLAANLRPHRWFNLRGTIGIDYTGVTDEFYIRNGDIPGLTVQQDGARNRSEQGRTVYSTDLGATAMIPVTEIISSRTTIGAQYNRRNDKNIQANGLGLTKGSSTFVGARQITASESFSQSAIVGWFLEETGIIRDRLFLTAAFRQDASSAFGKDIKAPIYPKMSFSWLISQEPFFPALSTLSSLRLRAAYGHAGVQPGVTSIFRTFTSAEGWVEGSTVPMAVLNSLGNSKLMPERSREFEFGLDASFLNERMVLDITRYRKVTHNALSSRSLPASLNGGGRQENMGSVLNSGIEITANATPVDLRSFSLNFVLGYSSNHNELLSLGSGVTPASVAETGAPEIMRPGYPISGVWARPILGYNDENGDGVLSESEVYIGDSAVYLGAPIPAHSTSLTTSLGLFNGRVRLSGLLDFRGKVGTYNIAEMQRCQNGICRAQVDPNASLSQQAKVIAATKRTVSPFGTYYGFMQSVSFTRLRNVSVSYQLPPVALSRLKVRTATLHVMGSNLALWSKYSGADPEVNTRPMRNYILDDGGIPLTRNWTFRVNLGI